ncbi:MAG: YbdD/YjiX family protein [Gemmatimonadales bacterium]
MKEFLRGALANFRRLVGMPDYQRYVAHLRAQHPERPVPSEREFYTEFVEAKYGHGASRCC